MNASRDNFLKLLFPDELGYIHLVALHKTKTPLSISERVPAKNRKRVTQFVEQFPDRDLYLGIAARRTAENGTIANCTTLAALFVDIDVKKDFNGNEAEACKKMDAFALKPTVVVNSGGGLHCYWVLNEPADISEAERPQMERRLRALIKTVGADLAAKDLSRILRLPGTHNFKYGTPAPVTFKVWEPSRRYTLEGVDSALGAALEHEPLEKAHAQSAPVEHGFDIVERVQKAHEWLKRQKSAEQGRAGDKHTFTICAAVVVGHDLDEEHALVVLKDWNERCTPPWPEHQLKKKINNAIRYASGQRGEKLVASNTKVLAPDKTDVNEFVIDFKGQILSNYPPNIRLALRRLGYAFAFNAFSQRPFVEHEKRIAQLDDAHLNRAFISVEEQIGLTPNKHKFEIVVNDTARRRAFHPVQTYLDRLTWDGTPRLETWLTDYLQVPDSPYSRAVGRLVLLAAVRRVRQPGAKFDEMLILESATQGTEKSSLVRAICPNEQWFSDDLPLHSNSKEVIERTAGKWIIEAADLHGYSRSESERLKAFLSRQTDGPVRLAYERQSTEVSRQFLIIGTTNLTASYFKDTTGNRRFWPVRVGRCRIDDLIRDRDQLWAEASHLETQNVSIRLSRDLWQAAADEQQQRLETNPWEEALDDSHLLERDVIAASELWNALQIPVGLRKTHHATDLERIMHARGFKKGRKRQKGLGANPVAVWIREGAQMSSDDEKPAAPVAVAVQGDLMSHSF